MKIGVPTTTNHAERFHSTINKKIMPQYNVYKRLGIIILRMKTSINMVNSNLYRQIRKHINQTKKKVDLNKEKALKKYTKKGINKFMQKHNNHNCNCFKKRFLTAKFRS